jgi:hypothetical protein
LEFAEAGSDWNWVAWIVPLHFGDVVDGYALFLCGQDVDHVPEPKGVFENIDEAMVAVQSEGVASRAATE